MRWLRGSVAWLALVLVTIVLRLRFAVSVGAVDADETVVLLMARRIAELRDLPVFHYGNAYLGSLDAVMAAVLLRVIGDTTLVARAVSVLLSLLVVLTTFRVGRAVGGPRVGMRAAAYVAAGPTLLVVWGAKLHLGYLDVLVLGGLLLEVVIRLTDGSPRSRGRRLGLAALAGLLGGLGFWCHVLFVVVMSAVGVFLVLAELRTRPRRPWPTRLGDAVAGLVGFGIGAAPLLVYNLTHHGATLTMLRRGFEAGEPLLTRTGSALYNLLVVGLPAVLGGTATWQVHRGELGLLLPMPVAEAVVWGAVLLGGCGALACLLVVRRDRGPGRTFRGRQVSLLGVAVLLLLGTWRVHVLGGAIAPLCPLGLPDPRDPRGTPVLVQEELFDRDMLFLLLWLPAVVAFAGCGPAAQLRARQGGERELSRPADGTAAPPRELSARLLIAAVAATSILLYVGTSYGLLRSPRFLFPLYLAAPVVLAVGSVEVDRWRRGIGMLLWFAVIAVNVAQQLVAEPALAMQPVHLAGRVEVPATYDGLVGCLDRLGYDRVYGGYWTAFPLILASDERILVSSGGVSRLGGVDEAVGSADRVAFVFYRDRLDERLFSRLLGASGSTARAAECGPFRIYAGLDVQRLRSGPVWDQVKTILAHP